MENGTDYRAILSHGTPLIDVRAPGEFHQGALPAAINLPLMDDEERVAVGTCYKQQGAQAALTLGHQLVSGELRASRITGWRNACQRYPEGYLCCARGGQRSHIVQQWLHEAGIDYPLVVGGYKALRQAAIQLTEELIQRPLILIGGCTGNGKTQLVCAQAEGIDLEGLAHHRGSSFGRTLQPQAAQATYENQLAVTLLKKAQHARRWIVEDEGYTLGANHLPVSLINRMAQSPRVVVEDPFPIRLARLQDEYFDRMQRDFISAYGEARGWQEYCHYLHQGLFAIRRRLGLPRFAKFTALLDQALTEQQRGASSEAHFTWLVPLLQEYYDPMYLYQLSKNADSILFRGCWQEVADWLAHSS